MAKAIFSIIYGSAGAWFFNLTLDSGYGPLSTGFTILAVYLIISGGELLAERQARKTIGE